MIAEKKFRNGHGHFSTIILEMVLEIEDFNDLSPSKIHLIFSYFHSSTFNRNGHQDENSRINDSIKSFIQDRLCTLVNGRSVKDQNVGSMIDL